MREPQPSEESQARLAELHRAFNEANPWESRIRPDDDDDDDDGAGDGDGVVWILAAASIWGWVLCTT